MANQLPHRLKLHLVIFLLLSNSLACLSLTGNTPSSIVEGTPEPKEVDEVIGQGSFHFPDPKAGMEELTSYKVTLTFSFDGTKDGQAQQWSTTQVLVSIKEPAARILTVETTVERAEGEPTLVAEMNNVSYQVGADGNCVTTVLEPTNSLIDWQDPTASLTGVIGAEEAGQETVNGVETNHFTFDESAMGEKEIKSKGELWIASQGGYIVRYFLTTTGDEDYFGEGTKGTLSLDYELTEVDEQVEILPPDRCPQGMVDAPKLTDASNITSVPGLLEYESGASVADAAAFY